MDVRAIFTISWLIPFAAAAGLLYYDNVVASAPVDETNTAMRERMCREHVDLAQIEPSNSAARSAVGECVDSGYLTQAQAEGITAID